MDDLVSIIDPRFESLTEVGHGSMGTVYRAWDRRSSSDVALKVLGDPGAGERFEREALVLSRIRHPNLVRYVAHGVARGGHPWLAMEWLEGEDLETRLARGPLGIQETIDLALALTAGLSCAHERGFIHRDIKPSNLFVPNGDVKRAKVLDFGLARTASPEGAITRTGTIMGTIEYMAPEQAVDAKRVDSRADVFSLGLVLYHCLSGVSPFRGGGVHEVLARVVSRDVPPISAHRDGVPFPLEALMERMMRKDPARRPRDAGHVASALTELVLDTAPLPRTTVRLRAPLASVTAVLAESPVELPPPSPRPRTAVLTAPPAPPSSSPPSSPLPSWPTPSSVPPSFDRPSTRTLGILSALLAAGGLVLALTAGLRGVVAPVTSTHAMTPDALAGAGPKRTAVERPTLRVVAPPRTLPPGK